MNTYNFLKRLGKLLVSIWIISIIFMVIIFKEMALLIPFNVFLGGLFAFPFYFLLLQACLGKNNRKLWIWVISIYCLIIIYILFQF